MLHNQQLLLNAAAAAAAAAAPSQQSHIPPSALSVHMAVNIPIPYTERESY